MTKIGRDRRKAALWAGAVFVVGTCVFGGTFALVRALGGGRGEAERLIAAGERTGEGLSMKTLEGGQWSLGEHVGHVVVVNTFATWCGPCMEEMPGLVKLAGEEAGKGVVFAGISLDQDSDGAPRMKTLREFAAKAGVTYPILVPDVDSSIFQTTTAIPQTMLIDKHGRRARTILGEATMEELRAAIDQLVSEP